MIEPRLEDPAMTEEIKLLAEIILTASHSDDPLPTEQIDRALGLAVRRHHLTP
jgi:hypothetical protein